VPVVHAGPATAAFAAPVTPSAVARWDRTGSRYGSGATSFGLTGRIVITVVTVLVGIWLAVTNVLGLGVFLLVAAWVLRDLWRPTHRPTPLPPSASAPASSQRFAQDASTPFGGPPAT
jgi:ABC-type nitrate/sulfonate/bicarbonate transport system permease component